MKKGNGVWKSSERVSGLDETVSEKGKMVMGFLTKECGGKCASFDKSVFRAQKNFEYEFGTGFRDKNKTDLDQNILEVGGDFETHEYRKAMGIIAIREEEILMSGKEMSIEYITRRKVKNSKRIAMNTTKRCLWGWKYQRGIMKISKE